MAGEVIGVQGVRITDLPEAEAVVDSNYMILVDEKTGRTYKVKREHIKAQKTSELVDDIGYMTESEVKEFTETEIAQLREVLNTWTSFKNTGGTISGDVDFSTGLNARRVSLKNDQNDFFSFITLNDTTIGIKFNDSVLQTLDRFGEFYIGGYSKERNGYTKLPNGLILQWGYVTLSKDAGHSGVEGFEVAINFPISFPTMPLSISCVPGTNNYDVNKTTKHLFRYDTLNNNGVSTYVFAESPGAWHVKMFYMAIGY